MNYIIRRHYEKWRVTKVAGTLTVGHIAILSDGTEFRIIEIVDDIIILERLAP